MRAGLLTEPITIMHPYFEINKYGERTPVTQEVYKTRANVNWDSGTRTIENGELVYNYAKTFTVRSYVPVKEQDIVVWQGKNYMIISVELRSALPYNEKIIRTELMNE